MLNRYKGDNMLMTKLSLNWNGISKLEDWMRKYYFAIVDEFGDKSFTERC